MKKHIRLVGSLLIFMLVVQSCNEAASPNTPAADGTEQTNPSNAPQKPQKLSPVDSLSRVLQKDPNNFEAYAQRAELYMEIGSVRAAANDIYNAMQIDSSSALLRNLKGQLNFAQNKTRQARDEWRKCIELDPENVDCRLRLAELLIAVQDYDAALKLVNDALTQNDKSSKAYYFKGLILRDFYQDTAVALQYFQKTVDLDPYFVSGLDMMGVMLAARGDTLAQYYYLRALELEPNNSDFHYKLGVFYMNNDKLNRALESYTKAVELNPRDAESYFNLGYMHINLRQFAQAREYFTQAIQARDGKNYRAFYGRGYCFEMLGDIINARKDYRGALQNNPIYKPAKDALTRLDGLGQ